MHALIDHVTIPIEFGVSRLLIYRTGAESLLHLSWSNSSVHRRED